MRDLSCLIIFAWTFKLYRNVNLFMLSTTLCNLMWYNISYNTLFFMLYIYFPMDYSFLSHETCAEKWETRQIQHYKCDIKFFRVLCFDYTTRYTLLAWWIHFLLQKLQKYSVYTLYTIGRRDIPTMLAPLKSTAYHS
jgi:hypothetical protein